MAEFNRPQQHKPTVERTITRLQEQELWLGVSHRGGSLFASDEQRRAAWFEHRDRLMGYWGNNGRRPQAWWKFEAPFKYPGFDREKSALWEAGLLAENERLDLEDGWRNAFFESLAPGFSFRGHNGLDAHLYFLIYHDCPADLAEELAAAPEAA